MAAMARSLRLSGGGHRCRLLDLFDISFEDFIAPIFAYFTVSVGPVGSLKQRMVSLNQQKTFIPWESISVVFRTNVEEGVLVLRCNHLSQSDFDDVSRV